MNLMRLKMPRQKLHRPRPVAEPCSKIGAVRAQRLPSCLNSSNVQRFYLFVLALLREASRCFAAAIHEQALLIQQTMAQRTFLESLIAFICCNNLAHLTTVLLGISDGSHLLLQQPRSVVERHGHVWVFRAEHLFVYLLTARIELLGLSVVALVQVGSAT